MSERSRPVWSRGRGAVAAVGYALLADATSLLPPRWRYAYVHRITRRLFRVGLPAVATTEQTAPPQREPSVASVPDTVAVLATDHLDIGGIGSVVEMLAHGLRAAGIEPVIVCQGDGVRARRLREQGITVHAVTDEAGARRALREARPDVIQLHSASPVLERLALESGIPLMPVLHNTEIHYTRQRWAEFTRLLEHSETAVAVSEVVRDFHAHRVPEPLGERIVVVPNRAPEPGRADDAQRRAARARLERTTGDRLGDDVVFLCLARFDAQKNIAGTVASFLRATEALDIPVRLIIAGEPSDRVELRRADGIRRSSRHADRVLLLANSDARTLLAAADAFLLNSFFEGWPVAATEAQGAGLPLILSDVGGAAELVARDPDRSVLVPNACGAAQAVTDARVGWARARSRRQTNAESVVRAVSAVSRLVMRERAVPPASAHGARPATLAPAGIDEMTAHHASLLRRAAHGNALSGRASENR